MFTFISWWDLDLIFPFYVYYGFFLESVPFEYIIVLSKFRLHHTVWEFHYLNDILLLQLWLVSDFFSKVKFCKAFSSLIAHQPLSFLINNKWKKRYESFGFFISLAQHSTQYMHLYKQCIYISIAIRFGRMTK